VTAGDRHLHVVLTLTLRTLRLTGRRERIWFAHVFSFCEVTTIKLGGLVGDRTQDLDLTLEAVPRTVP